VCGVCCRVFFALFLFFTRTHARTHTYGHARDGLLPLLLLGAGAGAAWRWCRSSARPLYYPVRLNSILKKPIISDKSAVLGFVVS